MAETVDFNLNDMFSIRLENPSPEAIRAVKNQVGVQPSVPQGEPDLFVRYVEQFDDPLCHLVMGKAGFSKDSFFIMSSNGQKDHRAQFPFDTLGQPCKVICESGVREIPLLNLIINLRMLIKGWMPIHASAFVSNGLGVIVNGWPKGGKTSILFSFLKHGAQFISDDWLFIDPNGTIHGLFQPIKLSDWQLDQLPEYQSKVPGKKRVSMQGMRLIDSVLQAVPDSLQTDSFPLKTVRKGLKRLNESQRHVNLSTETLFGPGLAPHMARLDVLLLSLSQEDEEIIVTSISTEVAVERLLATLQNEWLKWEEYYTQYVYAFPNRHNILMDSIQLKQRKMLEHILRDKFIFTVTHPHPVDLDDLYQKINQVLIDVKENKNTR